MVRRPAGESREGLPLRRVRLARRRIRGIRGPGRGNTGERVTEQAITLEPAREARAPSRIERSPTPLKNL
jgi:hypothetical protein